MRSPRRPVQREKAEQADIEQLAVTLGGRVWRLGTRRRRGTPCPSCGTFVPEHQGTRQSPGLPDLFLWLPARDVVPATTLWWEAKAGRNPLRPEQQDFRAMALSAGHPHGVGGVDSFVAWCVGQGRVKVRAGTSRGGGGERGVKGIFI